MNLYEKRRFITEVKSELPRMGLRTKRHLIATAEALADEVERLQKELANTANYKELYAALVGDWNAVCKAFETAGIDVASPFIPGEKIPVWRWKCADGATGTAATAGEAMAVAFFYRLGDNNKKGVTMTTDMAVYTFTKDQMIEVEVYDPESPGTPEYDLRGRVTEIKRVDGVTKLYVMRSKKITFYAVAHHGIEGLGQSDGYAEIVKEEDLPPPDEETTIVGPFAAKAEARQKTDAMNAEFDKFRDSQLGND